MDRTLTIFFTSDTHGYFAPVDYAASAAAPTGLANCAANFVRDGNSPFTYWLQQAGSAGGPFVPAKLMNLAGYQFVTLGNHDFNYGREVLERYLDGLDARCLCANIHGLPQVERTAVVTLENGLRFLADHLKGDVYFKIHRPGQNLDRARTQFALFRDMEKHSEEMKAILLELYEG